MIYTTDASINIISPAFSNKIIIHWKIIAILNVSGSYKFCIASINFSSGINPASWVLILSPLLICNESPISA